MLHIKEIFIGQQQRDNKILIKHLTQSTMIFIAPNFHSKVLKLIAYHYKQIWLGRLHIMKFEFHDKSTFYCNLNG